MEKEAKCLCTIQDVGHIPQVDTYIGTITINKTCPDHSFLTHYQKKMAYRVIMAYLNKSSDRIDSIKIY